MPTSHILVIPGKAPTAELPAIEVHSYELPGDWKTMISSVHLAELESEISVKFTTLMDRKPVFYDEAVSFAKQQALERGLTQVYARHVGES